MIELPHSPARLVAPSILSANFNKLGQEITAIGEAGADWVHIDVMDGAFVPNISIGVPVVRSIRKVTEMPLDVHLMIERPEQHISAFVGAGADLVTVHAEATVHLHRALSQIKQAGARAGVSLNPHTPLAELEFVLQDVDLVLLMSVNPGFGGQVFIPSTFRKLQRLSHMMARLENRPLISVDGGIGPANAGAVRDAGADVLVAGSAVFGSDSYAEVIAKLGA